MPPEPSPALSGSEVAWGDREPAHATHRLDVNTTTRNTRRIDGWMLAVDIRLPWRLPKPPGDRPAPAEQGLEDHAPNLRTLGWVPAPIDVVVHVSGETDVRAAQALAAEPGIGRIALLRASPPSSWGDRIERVETVEGFDVVVGTGAPTALEASEAGVAAVLTDHPPQAVPPSVVWASPRGLALALASHHPHATVVATVPGEPLSRGSFVASFPPPIGRVLAGEPDRLGVRWAPVQGDFGGVLVERDGELTVVTDDRRFLAAACLAAGVTLVPHLRGVEPVWEEADRYLAALHRFGLVTAAAVTRPSER